MSLEIRTEIQESIAIIHIDGEVDLYSSPMLRKEMMNVIKEKHPVIAINLGNVRYMDSSGVATLIEGLQHCGKYDGRFVLAALQNNVKEVFELTRLDKIFEIKKVLKDVFDKTEQ